MALATANSEELYLPLLERLNIKKHFTYVIDVNSCKGGKENSEICDRVASFFKVDQSSILVVEDSLTALKTAFGAGYNTIGVYDKNTVNDEEENKRLYNLV